LALPFCSTGLSEIPYELNVATSITRGSLYSLIDALQEGFVTEAKRALADLQRSEPHQASQARKKYSPLFAQGFGRLPSSVHSAVASAGRPAPGELVQFLVKIFFQISGTSLVIRGQSLALCPPL